MGGKVKYVIQYSRSEDEKDYYITDTTRRNDFYVHSIKEVERITGITFFPLLPIDVSEVVKSKADLKDW